MSEGIEIGTSHLAAQVHLPRAPCYILITDAELELLADMESNKLDNLFWGFLGVLLAGLLPALGAVAQIYRTGATNLEGALYLAVFAFALAAVLVSRLLARGFVSRREALLRDIESRPKIDLQMKADLKYP